MRWHCPRCAATWAEEPEVCDGCGNLYLDCADQGAAIHRALRLKIAASPRKQVKTRSGWPGWRRRTHEG